MPILTAKMLMDFNAKSGLQKRILGKYNALRNSKEPPPPPQGVIF